MNVYKKPWKIPLKKYGLPSKPTAKTANLLCNPTPPHVPYKTLPNESYQQRYDRLREEKRDEIYVDIKTEASSTAKKCLQIHVNHLKQELFKRFLFNRSEHIWAAFYLNPYIHFIGWELLEIMSLDHFDFINQAEEDKFNDDFFSKWDPKEIKQRTIEYVFNI